MNFFMVGSFFMLFMLNAGWTSNYVIKLVGFLFFAVGTAEAEERTDAFAHLKKPAYTSSAMCSCGGMSASIEASLPCGNGGERYKHFAVGGNCLYVTEPYENVPCGA